MTFPDDLEESLANYIRVFTNSGALESRAARLLAELLYTRGMTDYIGKVRKAENAARA